MPQKKKRSSERYPLKVTIRMGPAFECGPDDLACYESINISAGGALLKTPSPLPVGTDVQIELELPLELIRDMVTQKAKIQLQGSVIRHDEDGMAVCFSKDYKVTPVYEPV